jgi:hypothetical protein
MHDVVVVKVFHPTGYVRGDGEPCNPWDFNAFVHQEIFQRSSVYKLKKNVLPALEFVIF